MRVGLALAETGLGAAGGALETAQRALSGVVGEANAQARAGSSSVAHMLGIDDAVDRINQISTETAQAMGQSTEAVAELAEQAQTLQGLVNELKEG